MTLVQAGTWHCCLKLWLLVTDHVCPHQGRDVFIPLFVPLWIEPVVVSIVYCTWELVFLWGPQIHHCSFKVWVLQRVSTLCRLIASQDFLAVKSLWSVVLCDSTPNLPLSLWIRVSYDTALNCPHWLICTINRSQLRCNLSRKMLERLSVLKTFIISLVWFLGLARGLPMWRSPLITVISGEMFGYLCCVSCHLPHFQV